MGMECSNGDKDDPIPPLSRRDKELGPASATGIIEIRLGRRFSGQNKAQSLRVNFVFEFVDADFKGLKRVA